MTQTVINQLVERALALAAEAADDEAAIEELFGLSADDHALEQAMRTCLARPASLARRHRAIELLARVRYEGPHAPACYS
jgi:hypothetical protein